MLLERTRDFELIGSLLTHPDVYPMIGDDFAPEDPAEFRVNEHPAIWYVVACNGDGPIGMFSLMPENAICWQAHVVMMPWATKRDRWEAARAIVPWLKENTPCKRLTASIPATNWPALVFATHGGGMKFVGRQNKAFLKCGKLFDLILLGVSL